LDSPAGLVRPRTAFQLATRGSAPVESRDEIVENTMNLFSKTNLPLTLVIIMVVWAWLSLFSVVLGSLF
jgi:hypothetical protein